MSTRNRIIFNIGIALAVFFSPWWVFVPVMLLFVVFVRNPYEVLFWGLLVDSLYGFSGTHFFALGIFTWVTVAVLVLSILIKERLLFYNEQ